MAKAPESAIRYVESLSLPNLKRECIIRGLPFQDVGNMSVLNLQSWFIKFFALPQEPALLEAYDIWVEKVLKERGCDATMLSSTFRLSAVGERNAEGDIIKKKRVRSMIPRVKKKKERTAEGLFKGTKKSMTYDLARDPAMNRVDAIKIIKEKYPDAKEKSLGIWFNRARKQLRKNAKSQSSQNPA